MNPEHRTVTPAPEAANDNVDVNTIEGLLSFRESLVEVHEEIRALAQTHAPGRAREILEKTEEAYTRTVSTVDDCIDRREHGDELSDEDIDGLQEGYNALLEILDTASEAEVTHYETVSSDVVPVPTTEKVATVKPIDSSLIPVTPVTYEQEPVVESAIHTSEPSVEKEEDSEFLAELRSLIATADASHKRAEAMLEKYQEITEVIAADNVINIGQHYYNQLGVSAERARSTKHRLTEYLTKHDKLSELVLEHLKDTVQEIEENLDQLEQGLGHFFEADTDGVEEGGETAVRATSGSVGVGKEDEAEVIVPIVIKSPEPEPEVAPLSRQQVESAIAKAVANDNERQIHHAPLEGPLVSKAERGPRTSLSEVVDRILEIPRYKQFAARTFNSKAHLEVTLRREIQKIETAQTSGFFYETFGYKYANTFDVFLSTMTSPEIFEFDTQPYAVKKEVLAQKNVKYETYLAWVDMMAEMFELTHAHKDITFGELFVRSELEELMYIEAEQQEAA
ncbi:MAG: hypothetical protein RL538_437 [Candidatus Parcubacteria bacterium]|jgi:chemotaxis regulatin CheY-phosphate phosphatase CheZ